MCLQRWPALAVPFLPPVDTASLEPCLCLPGCTQKADICPPPICSAPFSKLLNVSFCHHTTLGFWFWWATQSLGCELDSPLLLWTTLLPGVREHECGPGGAELEGLGGGGLGYTENLVSSSGTAAQDPGQAWVPQPPLAGGLSNSQSSPCSALGGMGRWKDWNPN